MEQKRSQTWTYPIGCVLSAVALLLASPAGWADLTDEAVDRCMYQVGEFGASAVQMCVDQDVSAAKALRQYPREARDIVARCTQQMQKGGWLMVKTCADKDIEAAAALAQYVKAHPAVVEKCHSDVGDDGAAQVKACVEQAIKLKTE